MKVIERKMGRVFHLQLEAGDDFFSNVNPFVKEKNIRAGSVFIFGALREMDMITGFRSMNGYDVRSPSLRGMARARRTGQHLVARSTACRVGRRCHLDRAAALRSYPHGRERRAGQDRRGAYGASVGRRGKGRDARDDLRADLAAARPSLDVRARYARALLRVASSGLNCTQAIKSLRGGAGAPDRPTACASTSPGTVTAAADSA